MTFVSIMKRNCEWFMALQIFYSFLGFLDSSSSSLSFPSGLTLFWNLHILWTSQDYWLGQPWGGSHYDLYLWLVLVAKHASLLLNLKGYHKLIHWPWMIFYDFLFKTIWSLKNAHKIPKETCSNNNMIYKLSWIFHSIVHHNRFDKNILKFEIYNMRANFP